MKEIYIIYGIPGSGKTTISNNLKKHYGDRADFISVDELYISFLEGNYHYMIQPETRDNIEYHYNHCTKDIHDKFLENIVIRAMKSDKEIVIIEGWQLGEIINILNEGFLPHYNITNVLATKDGYLIMKGNKVERTEEAYKSVL